MGHEKNLFPRVEIKNTKTLLGNLHFIWMTGGLRNWNNDRQVFQKLRKF